MLKPRRHPRFRALCALAAAAAAALASGLTATGAPGGREAVGPAAARLTAAAAPVSPSQAQAQAQAAGQPVTVSALTTPTSQTTANPDGTFTVTESADPVRAWRGGAWVSLDPTLHANPDGTISPAVTTSGLVLSGGGTGPLAVMSAAGRSLSLSWPAPLPAPSLAGATATYSGVLPGVDLVVTADSQGGFSDVLVVKTAAAAASPALASLQLTVASDGLALTTDAAGGLAAAAGPAAAPLITAQAPAMWDSAPPPAGTATATGPDGVTVDAQNGLPAYSSLTAPGVGAHAATVPLTLSGNTLTLTPPASVLAGPAITYPVYIDPTWHNFAGSEASAWTQVDSGFPRTSYWKESSDLQVGDCYDGPPGSCAGLGVARSFIDMPIPPAITSTTVVHEADLYTTEVWAPSCTKTSVRLYTTSGIVQSTTWDHQPTWSSSYLYQDAAFGHDSSCPYYKNDVTWNVTETIADDAAASFDGQTWGLRAADETDTSQWKKFFSGAENLTLSVTYNYPPNEPSNLSTSPGGSCQTSSTDPAVIGDDDVTFSAYASDNDGDSLTTRFVIYNSGGSVAYDSANHGTSVATGNKTTAHLPLSRTVIQGFHTDGSTTAYTYYWQAQTTDEFSLASSWSDRCWFLYNPKGPSAPTVSAPAGPVPLGTQAAVTFTAPAGCSPTTSPCPARYTYQLGAARPVTVTADASGNWSGNITITQIGPLQLAVYGIASGGNFGEAATASILGAKPGNAYPDGYFTGGSYPDLLTTGTSATPSLWLSPGSGNGTLSPPTDIGSLGTHINPGTDGPGDWNGAVVLHGDFTGDNVQDVIAYYPTTGSGVDIAGNGNASSLVPDSGHVSTLSAGLMQNPLGDDPVQLFATGNQLTGAGNASQLSTGVNDLIGVSGDATNGYELDLYTNGQCTGCAFAGNYGYLATLSTLGPDNVSWKNYTLATAQPGGSPSATVLFALNNTTGALWESTNPHPGTQCTSYTPSIPQGCTLIGTPQSTWARISVPWGSSPPALASADINHGGVTELWTLTGSTATAYTLTGATLTQETPAAAVTLPSHDWPLTDGSPLAKPGATTATDTITGNIASLTSTGATWNYDDYFSTDISLDGTGYLTPPTNTIPPTDTTPSISIWFKTTTTTDGILVSLQNQPLSSGTTTPGGYNPVMYVGTDGKLYAEWWTGTPTPIASTTSVNDGLWHHALLTTTGLINPTQSLYLDGQLQGNLGAANLANLANLNYGAGYIGGSWPSEPHYHQNGNTGYLDHFKGQTADITITQ